MRFESGKDTAHFNYLVGVEEDVTTVIIAEI
jgi:hypothetical protein